jgi:drug/metabolite transporter (DMT)-like permease
MVAQAYGLQFISANRSAFLTSLNVLMVPLIGLALGVRPAWMVFFAAAVACVGVGLMSFDVQGEFWADLATLAAALAYAVYTILISARAKNHAPAQLAAAQIACMALLGACWMLADSGAQRLLVLPALVHQEIWWGLLYLGAVASAATFFLQALAQTHVSAAQAAIIYAMEPVFAAAFGWWYISEQMTPLALLGGTQVIVAVILSQRAEAASA